MNQTFNRTPRAYGKLEPGKVSTGTTILAMKFKEGVVLAADSRTTCKRLVISQFTDKLDHIIDKIYCCSAGTSADSEHLVRTVQQELLAAKYRGETITVRLAAVFFRNLMLKYRSLDAGIIVAGWDEKSKGEVFAVEGMYMKVPYSVDGSGSKYVIGLMQHKYRENMCKEECIELAKTCIKCAIQVDIYSGGVVRLVIITKDGVERQVHYNTPNGEMRYKDPKFWAEIQKQEQSAGV